MTWGIEQRRLAAILAADIAGYSALMGSDEEATVRDLKGHQAVVLPMIETHAGRVIDTAGDGILAEFASVLNAVKCAIAIQRVMADRNVAIDPSRRMQFRIGINLGDVIFDEKRIYGDGINVAARLESIAEPGNICISDKVYREVRGKIDVAVRDLGPKVLKNIEEPIRVYALNVAMGSDVAITAKAITSPTRPAFTRQTLAGSAAVQSMRQAMRTRNFSATRSLKGVLTDAFQTARVACDRPDFELHISRQGDRCQAS